VGGKSIHAGTPAGVLYAFVSAMRSLLKSGSYRIGFVKSLVIVRCVVFVKCVGIAKCVVILQPVVSFPPRPIYPIRCVKRPRSSGALET
jgi:hypothetical protein